MAFTRRGVLRAGIGMAGVAASPILAQEPFHDRAPRPGEGKRGDADSGRIIPPPPADYWPFSGLSGPGARATAASASGGWVSGMPDVRYKGPLSRRYPTAPWNGADGGASVNAGLLPRIRPLLDVQVRDPVICVGGDGRYYMTGSTGDNIWAVNDGVELWRSDDLVAWNYLGLVWSIARDGGWERDWRMRAGVPFRALWAPEIHYIAGTYLICHSVSRAGLGILRSVTGRPEGPYVHAFSADRPIRKGIDSTLFQDRGGAIWFTYGSAEEIVRVRDDLLGFADEWRPMIAADDWDTNPRHHRAECESAGYRHFGYEGATLFRRGETYYLGVVDNYDGRYSFAFWLSDAPTGPWRERHEGVPCAGGGNVFRDWHGRWWQTFFGNDDTCHFREKPGLVRIDFDQRGHVVVHRNQPFVKEVA